MLPHFCEQRDAFQRETLFATNAADFGIRSWVQGETMSVLQMEMLPICIL